MGYWDRINVKVAICDDNMLLHRVLVDAGGISIYLLSVGVDALDVRACAPQGVLMFSCSQIVWSEDESVESFVVLNFYL